MKRMLVLAVCLLIHSYGWAESEKQAWLNAGWGPQSNANQKNRTWGGDLLVYEYKKSAKQSLWLCVSYTYLATDLNHHEHMEAYSIFPQYTLYAEHWGKAEPYFFLRALGPSYISQTQLGSREQANHFAFQAQVGVGLRWHDALVSLSYKHFSNGYLFSPNDGIDVPLVLTLGKRW